MSTRRVSRLHAIDRFVHESGHSFLCELPADFVGDSPDAPSHSRAEVFEDGTLLGPPHSEHEQIRRIGGGRYSHWGWHLYFSTSDNTDPRRNKRKYHLYLSHSAPDPGASAARPDEPFPLTDQAASDRYAIAESRFYEVFPRAFIGEFGKVCWDDQTFVTDYLRLVPGNRRSFERKYVVAQLVRAVKRIAGDIAECGVYNGATAYFMARATREVGVPRAMHLFDSFTGLSRPEMRDGTYWHEGALAMPETAARETLAPFEDVAFYAGWIPERFHEVAEHRFAFVHIDVDLYQPTLEAMRFFYPRVPPAGMLLCDDYGFTTCPGARAAVQEFMADKPEAIIELPTGQGLVIRG